MHKSVEYWRVKVTFNLRKDWDSGAQNKKQIHKSVHDALISYQFTPEDIEIEIMD